MTPSNAATTATVAATSWPSPLPQRRLGEFSVSAIGLGCMNLSHAYGAPPPRDQAERLLLGALDAGCNFFDTAALYGFGTNETLVGEVLAPHRARFLLASKCGMTGVTFADGVKRVIDGRPETIQATCEAALKRLRTEVIDLYYLHRWDKQVPIEDSVGALADLVRAGKIRSIGLSEVSGTTLRKAHAVHPITAVQNEYSLWSRNPEISLLGACRELGVALVAFSPVARGFLCGQLRDVSGLDAKDIRRSMPRFAPGAWAHNLALLPAYEALAAEAGVTPAQLALAWLLAQGEDILPIPGTTSLAHLQEDLGAATLQVPAGVLARAEALINRDTVVGRRYNAQAESEVDTEEFRWGR
jgi:aryl-alcohol dehydrogenase-like predicted oxidoreductase